jgi:hypothetical protein
LYFSFPKFKTELEKSNNFKPANALLSPRISKIKTEHGEKIDNYYSENWFITQDYEFRESANDTNNFKLSFATFNYDYFGNLNKSSIYCLQTYFNEKGKSYILNIIFYVYHKLIKHDAFQHSLFLLFNNTKNTIEKEKYSDNKEYTIGKLNIVELSLSSKMEEYFHFGTSDKNENFINHGISFDIMDIESLGEPFTYYDSSEYMSVDLRYFSVIYLYALLFQKLEYNKTKNIYKDLNELHFEKNSDIIENICQEFNFDTYFEYLVIKDIDCWNNQNLLYYAYTDNEREEDYSIMLNEYISRPYCICLPLYCIENNKKDADLDNIKIMEEIKLPEQCQTRFNSYLNSKIEDFKYHAPKYNPELKVNYGLNNIDILSKGINNILEDEFFIFKTFQLIYYNNITVMDAIIVNNSDSKRLYCSFIENINVIKSFILLILLIGMFVSIFLGVTLLIINVKKISNVIIDFKKIYDNYLSKLESSKNEKNEITENMNYNKNSENNKEKKMESHFEDIKKKKRELEKKDNDLKDLSDCFYSNDNSIFNDLYKIFSDYYKFTILDFNKKLFILSFKDNDKDYNKSNQINELFELLKRISIYIPKFKIEVSMDYNFYINSKFIKNYLKSITKNEKENEQQIMLTKSLIYELLSTEDIKDCGIITNFIFKYITDINVNYKIDKNSIKISFFNGGSKDDESDDEKQILNIDNSDVNEEKNLIEEKIKRKVKIICKGKNALLNEFEKSFENDDYLKKEKLKSYFNSYLINVYYKYINKIVLYSDASFNLEENKN